MKIKNQRAVTIVAVIVFLAVAIGLYIIIYVIPTIAGYATQTYKIEHADLPLMDEEEALFVRDETLYLAWTDGRAEYIAEEGEKVRAGMQVFGINTEESPPKMPVDEESGEVISPYTDIAAAAGEASVTSENGVVPVTAITSYFADGYEQQISLASVYGFNDEMIADIPEESTPIDREWVYTGEPVYKLTDNNIWYVALWLELEDDMIMNYVIGDTVILDLETTKISATVEDVKMRENDWFILLSSDMYYRDLVKYRKKTVIVIFEEYSGAVIENESIISKDDHPGVYVKQRTGAFKWVPIERIRTSEGKCIIAEDVFYDDDGNQVDTINYYDEILRNPKKEGYD